MAPVTVLVTYRPKKGKERAFLNILKRHWLVLRRANLVTWTAPSIWKATAKKTGQTYYVEMFEWKDARASEVAHRTLEVLAVWDPMEPLLESMDIAVVNPVAIRSLPTTVRPA